MAPILIVCGGESDLVYLAEIKKLFVDLGISFQIDIISCHRNLNELVEYFCSEEIKMHGPKVIIALANSVSNLPAVIAGLLKETLIQIIGVGISKNLNGLDSLVSVNTIPKGVPVVNTGIGEVGVYNAGIVAARVIAKDNETVREALSKYFQTNKKIKFNIE